jgi:hypothetical protein
MGLLLTESQAVEVIPHPFGPAFGQGGGRDKRHQAGDDQGCTFHGVPPIRNVGAFRPCSKAMSKVHYLPIPLIGR